MKEADSDISIKTIASHDPRILLQRPIVKPLYGIAPREIKGKEWWDKTRADVYRKHNFHCIACGVHKTNAKEKKHLEAHEWYDVDYGNRKYVLKEIIPLCHYCHAFIHYQRSAAMLECGNYSAAKYNAIMKHGNEVLEELGLIKDYNLPPEHYPENDGSWKMWYLEFDGNKYYSKFENVEALTAYYEKLNSEIGEDK